jgi:hypothetical protein
LVIARESEGVITAQVLEVKGASGVLGIAYQPGLTLGLNGIIEKLFVIQDHSGRSGFFQE